MKQKIINSIIENCNVRLKPSKVCSGVGVFSIIPIKKGTVIFKDVTEDNIHIKWEEIKDVDKRVKEYLKIICNFDEEGIYLSRTVNNINLSYFVNHSDKPNVKHDLDKDVFIALRDIDIDEELVCVYDESDKVDF
jgi:hypothetical protein